MTPEQARTAWLEREVTALQAAMHRMQRGSLSEEYWGKPVDRDPQGSSQARRDGDDREDPLRSVPIVLPRLADSSSKTASLEAGDWLAQLRPLIGDVSEHAGLLGRHHHEGLQGLVGVRTT